MVSLLAMDEARVLPVVSLVPRTRGAAFRADFWTPFQIRFHGHAFPAGFEPALPPLNGWRAIRYTTGPETSVRPRRWPSLDRRRRLPPVLSAATVSVQGFLPRAPLRVCPSPSGPDGVLRDSPFLSNLYRELNPERPAGDRRRPDTGDCWRSSSSQGIGPYAAQPLCPSWELNPHFPRRSSATVRNHPGREKTECFMNYKTHPRAKSRHGISPCTMLRLSSLQRESNPRPAAYKAAALTGLSYRGIAIFPSPQRDSNPRPSPYEGDALPLSHEGGPQDLGHSGHDRSGRTRSSPEPLLGCRTGGRPGVSVWPAFYPSKTTSTQVSKPSPARVGITRPRA